jgi:hypothetical protein
LGTLTLIGMLGWWQRSRALQFEAPQDGGRLAGVYYGLAFLLLAAFFAFPIVHTRWGDAYMLANGLAWPDPALRLTHSWQAPLDVQLHSRLWHWLGPARGWEDAVPVYRLLSPVAGALFLGVVLALTADRRLAPAWVTFGLLTSLGLLQLFFGYVENYSFAAAGVLAYLWLGIGVLRGRRSLWLAASVLALTNATHPSTIVLAPSLLYLGWAEWARASGDRSRNALRKVGLSIALPMFAVAGLTLLLMEAGGHGIHALLTTDRPGGGDARWFVPLMETQTRWEQYTMFSWPHLRDFLNEQMLVAPVVLPALVIIGVYGLVVKGRGLSIVDGQLSITDAEAQAGAGATIADGGGRLERRTRGEIDRFLVVATVFYLLFTWVWNPDYGGQRDWDLFSLAALPMTLLLIVKLPRALGWRAALIGGAAPLILVQALHTIAWIYQNTLPWAWP